MYCTKEYVSEHAGDVIELVAHFREAKAHVTVSGRVRIVKDRVWVGQLCLPRNTECELTNGEMPVYHVHL